jgi:hypothetical protein
MRRTSHVTRQGGSPLEEWHARRDSNPNLLIRSQGDFPTVQREQPVHHCASRWSR